MFYEIIKPVIETLLSDQGSVPFRDPVDFIRLGLPDYPAIIKAPMDLRTIKVWKARPKL